MSSGGFNLQPFFFSGRDTSPEINSDVCPLNFTFQCGSHASLSPANNVPATSLQAEPSTSFPVANLGKSTWCGLNKRPLIPTVEEKESELDDIPRKMRITEEAISTRFSTMDISTNKPSPPPSGFPSSFLPLNTGLTESTLACSRPQESTVAALASTQNLALTQSSDSDEESTDDTNKPRLVLPQELQKDLNQLKSTGGLSDSDIQILMRPQPCLALVPYTPRISLPGLATKKPAPQPEEKVDRDEEDSDKDATMDASGPPPTCLTSQPLLSWPYPSFSPPSGASVQTSSFLFNRPFSWPSNFGEKP